MEAAVPSGVQTEKVGVQTSSFCSKYLDSTCVNVSGLSKQRYIYTLRGCVAAHWTSSVLSHEMGRLVGTKF